MQTKQTANELTFQETPGCVWIFSLILLIFGGLFVYGSLGNFSNNSTVEFWLLPITFLMGSIAVGFGARLIYNTPITKLVFDLTDETLLYTTYGLTGKKQTLYDFDEIEMFSLIEERDSEGAPVWSLGMNLSNGETIKVSSLSRQDEKFKLDLVFRANDFMSKQIPAAPDVFELESEYEQ